MPPFTVEFTVTRYETLAVEIDATTEEAAKAKAEEMCRDGTIWDDGLGDDWEAGEITDEPAQVQVFPSYRYT